MTESYEYDALQARTIKVERAEDRTVEAAKPASKPVSLPVGSESPMREPKPSSIDPEEFRAFLEHATSLGDAGNQPLKTWLDHAEAWKITRALRKCRGNRSATARALGIGRRTLYAKMEKLGITANWGL